MQPISSVEYRMLLERFSQWLELQGYACSTVYQLPRYVQEWMAYLEHRGIESIGSISSDDVQQYLEALSMRPNHRRGGGLSSSYLRKHIQGLMKFSEYIRKSGLGDLEVRYTAGPLDRSGPAVLSESEVRRLYQSCDVDTALGQRDRAMLSVYYGCGLRRSEGVALDVCDVDTERGMVHVRQGKGYRERYVPLSVRVSLEVRSYMASGRVELLGSSSSEALLIVGGGNRASGDVLYKRLQLLCSQAGLDGGVGLHSLRHSIATHLMGGGMPLEQIGLFLGHKSMESTQLYTHLKQDREGRSGRV